MCAAFMSLRAAFIHRRAAFIAWRAAPGIVSTTVAVTTGLVIAKVFF